MSYSTDNGDNTPHQPHAKSQNVDSWNRYSHLFEDGSEVVTRPEKRQHAPGLIDEAPIPVYPTLAALIGINEAVTLQQIHFLLNTQRTSKNHYNYINGRWWVYNSYHQWRVEHFPWLSESSIKRLLRWHESNGYLLSMQSVKNKSDRRKWYTVDYVKWSEFLQTTIGLKWSHQPSDQNSLMVGLKESDGYSESTSESTDISVASDDAVQSKPSRAKTVRSVPKSKAEQYPDRTPEEWEAIRRKAIDDAAEKETRQLKRSTDEAELYQIVFEEWDVKGDANSFAGTIVRYFQCAPSKAAIKDKSDWATFLPDEPLSPQDLRDWVAVYRRDNPGMNLPMKPQLLGGKLNAWIARGKPTIATANGNGHRPQTALDRAYSDVNGGEA